MTATVKVFLVALALALDVFAVSVGVGVRGIAPGLKVRIGLAFATAEVTMVVIGAGLGLAAGHLLGDVAGYFGFAALIVLGLYMIRESMGDLSGTSRLDLSKGWGLMLASLSISFDSLGIGFSILYIGVPLPESLFIIGGVSICATAAGLTLGRRLGAIAEGRAAFIGGLLLALTGATFVALKLLHLN